VKAGVRAEFCVFLACRREFKVCQHVAVGIYTMLLKKWFWWTTHSRLEPLREAAHTIKRHWQCVINWKLSRISNGLLKGLNSLIQTAKSKAKGYSISKNFKIIAYLVTGKLDFGKINHSIRYV